MGIRLWVTSHFQYYLAQSRGLQRSGGANGKLLTLWTTCVDNQRPTLFASLKFPRDLADSLIHSNRTGNMVARSEFTPTNSLCTKLSTGVDEIVHRLHKLDIWGLNRRNLGLVSNFPQVNYMVVSY